MIKHLCKGVPSNGERQMLEAASVTGHKDTDALYTFKSRGFGREVGLVYSVNSNVVFCLAASVPLVTESMATMMVSLPSVVVSDIPVIFQLVEVLPAAMGWVVLSLR